MSVRSSLSLFHIHDRHLLCRVSVEKGLCFFTTFEPCIGKSVAASSAHCIDFLANGLARCAGEKWASECWGPGVEVYQQYRAPVAEWSIPPTTQSEFTFAISVPSATNPSRAFSGAPQLRAHSGTSKVCPLTHSPTQIRNILLWLLVGQQRGI